MRTLWHKLRSHLLEPLLDVLYPPVCVHCQEPVSNGNTLPLCGTCRSQLIPINPEWVHQQVFQRIESPQLDGLIVALEFNSVVQSLIHQLKYRMMAKIGKQLGELIAPLVANQLPPMRHWMVIPVPLHPRRRRERGYNQSEQIAGGLASQLGWVVEPGRLHRIRHTRSQTNLNRMERQQNVNEAFRAAFPFEPVDAVLLVDDVVTTGATMNACASALKRAGVKTVIGIAVATPRTIFNEISL